MPDSKGLGIDKKGRTCGGVSHMSQGHISFKIFKDLLIEYIRDQTHGLVLNNPLAVRNRNASAFLTPVLKGIETEIGQLGRLFMSIDGKDAALLLGAVGRHESIMVVCHVHHEYFVLRMQLLRNGVVNKNLAV